MKIVVVSDTHNQHENFRGLTGDVLVHCGDMFNLFDRASNDVKRMDAWFGSLDFDQILCVGGNHDLGLEAALWKTRQPFRNATVLQDTRIALNGVVFYGAPWVPMLKSHAFYQPDHEIKKRWSLIPEDVDVLITHSPPAKILDRSRSGARYGCGHLAAAVERVRPRLHCFGHVHASAGILKTDHTIFVNACSVDSQMNLVYEPYEDEG